MSTSAATASSIYDLEVEEYLHGDDLAELLKELEGRTDLDEDETDLLDMLRELSLEHIDTLINEREFNDYARETAYDCGMVSRDSPLECYIDWDRWAEACQMDYTNVEIGSTTFYCR